MSQIERALFTNTLKKVNKEVNRIYFGNEFCENLIPSLVNLKNAYSFFSRLKKKFTLVTPYITNRGIKRLRPLLAFLDNQGAAAEVVFNDWGVFKLIKEHFGNLTPVAGRLLSKQRRDPRMLKILQGTQVSTGKQLMDKKTKIILLPKPIPNTLCEHFQSSVVDTPFFQKFLIAEGIGRIEIDNLIWEMRFHQNKKIALSIYFPYGYISTTRACGRLTLTYKGCKRECRRYYLKYYDDSLPVPFYGIGNTIFYKNTLLAYGNLRKLGINRIVFQEKLPF